MTAPPPPVAPLRPGPPEERQPPRQPRGERTNPIVVVLTLLLPVAAAVLVAAAFQWMRTTEASRAIVVIVAVVVGVGGIFAVFYGLDRIVDLLPHGAREYVRPWVFVGPAIVLVSVFLVYPAVNTIVVSFRDAAGTSYVGFENYSFVFSDAAMLRSIRNTVAWMLVVPAVAVSVGLVFAVLTDRLARGESLAKSLIFLPMAISFVGASVVWAFMYDFRVFGNQTGLLNGIWTGLGNDAVAWLSWEPWNNLFLMVIMIWMQTGFAMVILSAAIKSVPDELLEAGRIDGASELQLFWRITIPSIMSALVVVTTTMVINVLKVFDIVWVTTSGQAGTEVIAERMMRWFFSFRHSGRGAAIAVLLFLAIVPIMFLNVRRFRAEEEIR